MPHELSENKQIHACVMRFKQGKAGYRARSSASGSPFPPTSRDDGSVSSL
jgi:hypothetical protein